MAELDEWNKLGVALPPVFAQGAKIATPPEPRVIRDKPEAMRNPEDYKTLPPGWRPMVNLPGAVLDTVGLGRMEGDPLGRAVFDPQNIGERLLLPAISGRGVAAGGLALGSAASGLGPVLNAIAPAVGRAATQAGVGALRNAARSESKDAASEAAHGALTDGLVALATEAIIPASAHLPRALNATKAASGLAAKEAAFTSAASKPMEALDAVASRLQGIKTVNIPSLGGKLTPTEAVKKLGTLEGNAYVQARQELIDQFNALDRSGFATKAGELFNQFTAPARWTPKATATEKAAKAFTEGTKNPRVRAVADVLAATEGERGVPLGPAGVAAAGMAGGAHLGGMLRRATGLFGH